MGSYWEEDGSSGADVFMAVRAFRSEVLDARKNSAESSVTLYLFDK